jgi:hypothetical protein
MSSPMKRPTDPSAPIHQVRCLDCGANNVNTSQKCWLCGKELAMEPELIDQALRTAYQSPLASSVQAAEEGLGGVITLVLGVVVALPALGIAAEEPGMLVPYFLVVVPAFIGMQVTVSRYRAKGRPLGAVGRVVAFFVSAAVVFGVLALLAVAAIAAFFLYCSMTRPFHIG